MANSLRVLIVEDCAADAVLILRELRRAGYEPISNTVNTEEEYLQHLAPTLDLIVSDYFLPQFSQERALRLLKERDWDVPFVILSDGIGEERAVTAIKNGAFDWIPKSNFERLGTVVQNAITERNIRGDRKRAHLRNIAFSLLGQRLSSATSPQQAAQTLFEIADQLFGWDACSFDSYSAEDNRVTRVYNVDTVGTDRSQIHGNRENVNPTPREQRAMAEGGQLILREPPFMFSADALPYGDVTRPSASIIFVPVRNAGKTVGFCSIQSYKPHAYTPADLNLFQTLVDFCGGALERIRAQQTLQRNEERYRSLITATSQMVWTAAADGQVVDDSPTWRGYTGQTWEQFKGWGWILALHPEDIDAALQLWKTAIRTRSLFLAEVRIRSADSNYRHFAVRAAPVLEPDGTIREWVATCSDVTDSKRAELRNETFFHLARQLNIARTPEEAARRIVEVADKLFGWDACYLHLYSPGDNAIHRLLAIDTINGQKCDVPLLQIREATPTMQRVLKTGGELILKDPSLKGDFVPFGSPSRSESMVVVPIHNGTETIGFLSIQSYTANAYDQDDLNTLQALADFCGGVLERLHAEEALYETEERFRTVIEQAADAILVYDAKGVIVDANLWACRSLGYSQQELLGLSIEQVNASLTEAKREEIARVSQSSEPSSLDAHHRRKDGSMFPVEVRIGLLELKKQRLFLALARDVTERKQLEEQYRQSQKMEAFGQLAGGVAHDFNNLLTVISGYTNLVLSNDALDQDTREQLQEIFSASEKATNLTRQLLTFSRKREIQPEAVHLSEVVANMTKILKRIIGEDIRLECDYAPNLPIVQADIGMLEQILLNLAVNARDAMPKGGRVLITTTAEQIKKAKTTGAYPGKFVCLTVTDTGCGMPCEIAERIFEPFFTTKGGKGTGLGLATVYSIVKQHRGWIEVDSQVDRGTSFKIFMPASVEKSNDVKPQAAEPTTVGGSETILLVEDESALRSLARQILQRQGYHVLEAESGLKALSVWEQHSSEINLLLTDMVMPDGLTGADLAKKLQQDRPELKVIFTSGYTVVFENPDCEFREGYNFLQKPYHPRKLTKAVRDRLDEPVTV